MRSLLAVRPGILAPAVLAFLVSTVAHSECVSTTLAEQVYYSCSGVLTVFPIADEARSGQVITNDPAEQETSTIYANPDAQNHIRPDPVLPIHEGQGKEWEEEGEEGEP